MKLRLLAILLFLSMGLQWGMAQAPKWLDKAKKSVFSIVTYDTDDKILNTGNGFFVTEDGIALSDYSLFEGAKRAVILNSDGKQMAVEAIMGADDMYDVVKFKVAINGKKVPALAIAEVASAIGSEVCLLPYATQKERIFTKGIVEFVDKVDGKYAYYKLNLQLKDKMISCPVMNADGQVLGLAQKTSGQDTATISYAIDANFAMNQHITALSYNNYSLKNIGIKKALPDTEEQALVFLYMVSSQLTPEKYAQVLDDFIAQYPNSSDGYIRRATNKLMVAQDDTAMIDVVADLDKALQVAADKDDAYYNRSKLIYSYLLEKSEKTYKDWSYDKALSEIEQAIAINPLPAYISLQGDIYFAKQDYSSALACYEKVNQSNLASAASFLSSARTKELLKAPKQEILALMDSCIARLPQPYTEIAAPYLLQRAQYRTTLGEARIAMLDYDAYFNAVNGRVNDAFYYYREQAAMKAKQYQRALDDMAKAIELNPKEMLYRAELAVVNIRVGHSEEAVKVLRAALDIEPKYAEAYRLMGIAQLQLKQNKEACASFAKAKELGDPNVDELINKHCK